MQTRALQQQRVKAAILLATCIALAIFSASCGGGATQAVPTTADSPTVSLSPISLSFGSQPLESSSSAQSVTLTNTGNGALTISSITVSGDFTQANNCGTSVAAGANCTISVTFKPTGAGTRSGTLSISDNAAGSPHTVTLSGSGAAAGPAVALVPADLTFSSQIVGTTSGPQAVTLTNTGNAPLTISSLGVSGVNAGDFVQTNNCGSSVAAGANCTISVTFTPSATGARSGSLSIADNASGSPQTVGLAGTGTSTAAVVSLSPTSLSFGNQPVGTTSMAETSTLPILATPA